MQNTDPARLDIVKRFLVLIGNQDIDAATKLLSPHVLYRVPVHNEKAGKFSGPGEVAEHLAHLFEAIRGTFDLLKWEDWLVGEQRIGALATVRMQRNGQVITEEIVFLLTLDEHNQISTVNLYLGDPEQFQRFLR
jgi:ketosteroid isomerase-like protein